MSTEMTTDKCVLCVAHSLHTLNGLLGHWWQMNYMENASLVMQCLNCARNF